MRCCMEGGGKSCVRLSRAANGVFPTISIDVTITWERFSPHTRVRVIQIAVNDRAARLSLAVYNDRWTSKRG